MSNIDRKKIARNTLLLYVRMGLILNIILCKLTGLEGRFLKKETKLLLEEFDRFKPDILHLHCIHGWYVNAPRQRPL